MHPPARKPGAKPARKSLATDSSAILGIGDQGYGGLAIPIGKLALYTVGGGVSPFHTMPVSLDVGTERLDLINDPTYLGVRQRRLKGKEYIDFLDKFVDAVASRYPDAVIQWEDLAKETAFTVLERYRERHPSFNDDIQGTGGVALAGVISACHLKGERLVDQRVVVHGAGAGGVGVALAIQPLQYARQRPLEVIERRFDSGERRWRSQMENTTMAQIARNSLCQFWKDWNQNCALVMNESSDTGASPCSSCCSGSSSNNTAAAVPASARLGINVPRQRTQKRHHRDNLVLDNESKMLANRLRTQPGLLCQLFQRHRWGVDKRVNDSPVHNRQWGKTATL